MTDTANPPNPDWPTLRAAARAAAETAYAPYSGLHVGAAGLTPDGDVVSGCNVENASYGLTLCAECGLVSALRRSGASALVAVAVVGGDGEPLAPCGRCRQLLLDHGGPSMLIDAAPQPVSLGDLLPGAFDAAELASRRDEGP
ncbi:MAG: cytidine deaminase [Acidimicrobiales bacterium]